MALNQSVILGTAGVGARNIVRGFHPASQTLTEQVFLSWIFRYTMAVVLKGAQGGERGLFKGKRFSSLPLVRLEFSNQRSKKDFTLGFCLEPTEARCCHRAWETVAVPAPSASFIIHSKTSAWPVSYFSFYIVASLLIPC